MAEDHSILPFPADIDRNAFGHWLSGFVDGEGCFLLSSNSRNTGTRVPTASFKMDLRADDAPILRLIQSFLGVGSINPNAPTSGCKSRENLINNPKARYLVHRYKDLASVLVPHFEKYPLHSKKRRDFNIWKDGVKVICRHKRTRWRPWSKEDEAEFFYLHDQLRHTRRFSLSPSLPFPPRSHSEPPTLF